MCLPSVKTKISSDQIYGGQALCVMSVCVQQIKLGSSSLPSRHLHQRANSLSPTGHPIGSLQSTSNYKLVCRPDKKASRGH
ncbi:hypothetical protein ACRRTK_022605 [Alexandromys fortis]